MNMNKKRSFLLGALVILVLAFALLATGCEKQTEAQWPVWDMRDGDYRGHFDDREHNVSVQITLEDEKIASASIRHQQYDGVVYERNPEIDEDYFFDAEQIEGMAAQYEEALNYLEGAQGKEEIVERLEHMEGTPEGTPVLEAIETEVDGVSGATIRSSKLGSAVRDAFNRGRYRE